jgi:hypothetical protein
MVENVVMDFITMDVKLTVNSLLSPLVGRVALEIVWCEFEGVILGRIDLAEGGFWSPFPGAATVGKEQQRKGIGSDSVQGRLS